MSVSTTIKNNIILNIQKCSTVQQVYGHEEMNPTGFPAVMVKATDMQGEFSSNAENSRIYSYLILIIFPVGQDFKTPNNMNRMEYAEQVVASVIDEIVNISDTDFVLAGSDPTVRYVNAADCTWGDYEYEGGVAKAAQITLKVYTDTTI